MTISASRRRSAMDVSHGGGLCSAARQSLAQPQDACVAPYQSMETTFCSTSECMLGISPKHCVTSSRDMWSAGRATARPTHINANKQYPCMAQTLECSADDRQCLEGSQEGCTCRHVRLRPHARAEQHLLHEGQRFFAPPRLLPRSIHPLVEVGLQAGAAGEHTPLSSASQRPCPWQPHVFACIHSHALVFEPRQQVSTGHVDSPCMSFCRAGPVVSVRAVRPVVSFVMESPRTPSSMPRKRQSMVRTGQVP